MTGADPISLLRRIAEAIERLAEAAPEGTPRVSEGAGADGGDAAPPAAVAADADQAAAAGPNADDDDLSASDAYVWHMDEARLLPVVAVNRIDLALLRGIERQAEVLLENTRRFARGLPANNALLWGARGTGKSSLVKAVHAKINEDAQPALALVEVHREDIASLPKLLAALRDRPRRFILFCDDLSFDGRDASYKSLKTVLEGGIEGRPQNVVFYATSNRSHLMPREMIENERSTAINPAEAVEEKVSLSDRFGLWLGFHPMDQATFLAIVAGYAEHYRLALPADRLQAEALSWAAQRGARSGRVAWQFIQDLAGRLGQGLE